MTSLPFKVQVEPLFKLQRLQTATTASVFQQTVKPSSFKASHFLKGSLQTVRKSPSVMLRGPVLFGGDLKIVIHGKYARDAFGADARGVFISFVVDNAFQRDVSALHDDADGLLHS